MRSCHLKNHKAYATNLHFRYPVLALLLVITGISVANALGVSELPAPVVTLPFDDSINSAEIVVEDSVQPDDIGELPTESINEHTPGFVVFGEFNTAVNESGSTVTIPIVRQGGDSGFISVEVNIAGISTPQGSAAVAGKDYSSLPPTLIFWNDGESGERLFNINLLEDDEQDGTKNLEIVLKTVDSDFVVEKESSSRILVISDTDVEGVEGQGALNIDVVSGNLQSIEAEEGAAAAKLNPFVVRVLDNNGTPVSGVPISWAISPVTSGILSNGSVTETGESGGSSNTFTINTAEEVIVTARLVSANNDASPKSSNILRIQTRMAESDSVSFIINGSFPKVQNPPEIAVAKNLEEACKVLTEKEERSAEEEDLLNTCADLFQADDDSARESLRRLAPEELSSMGVALVKTANLQVMNVNSRLNALRAGVGGFNVSGLNVSIEQQLIPGQVISLISDSALRGGSAGDDLPSYSPWGAFINGNISFGSKDETASESGFDFNAWGITAGIDYRYSSTMVLGGAVGYGGNDSDFDGGNGDMEMNGWHLSGYGTYYRSNKIYIDGLVKIGRNDYKTRRQVNLVGESLQIAAGTPNGSDYSFSLGAGYDYNSDAFAMTPYGRINHITAKIDGFVETPLLSGTGIGSVMRINSQRLESFTVVAGGQFSYTINTKKGVFLPQLRVEWEHEFRDDNRRISGQFVGSPVQLTLNVPTDKPDRDYANLGLGFSTIASGGRSGYFYYETRLGQDDITQHWLKAGLRFEF